MANLWAAEEAPQSLTLDGRLYSDATTKTPLLDSGTLKIQILDQNSVCILYEETQNFDTRGTDGAFNIHVGEKSSPKVKRTSNDPGHSLSKVFANNGGLLSGKLLSNGAACTGAASAGSLRLVQITVIPDSDGTPRSMTPFSLNSVPSAIVAERAESLGGIAAGGFLQVNNIAPNSLSQSNLENVFSTVNYPRLMDLLSGASSSYVRTGSNGSILTPEISGTPASPLSGQMWYDAGVIKYWNGSSVQTLSSGSGITSLTVGAGLTPAGTITAGGSTIAVDVGTSAGQIVAVQAGGKLPALDGSDLTGVVASGLSATASINTSGTIASGAITSTGAVIGTETRSNSVKIYRPSTSNYVELLAPSSLSSVLSFRLPTAMPAVSGYVLSSDTSGNMSWVAQTPAGLSAVSNSASLADGKVWVGDGAGKAQEVTLSGDATISNTGVVTLKNTGTAGTYKSVTTDAQGRVTGGTNPTTLSGFGITDGVLNAGGALSIQAGVDSSKPAAGSAGRVYMATDTSKIYRDNGTTWDTIASNSGTGISALTGDVTASGTGSVAATVARIQGVGVSVTSPTTTGQVLKYNSGGTQYAPGFIGVADVRSTVAGNAQFFPTNCTSGQTLTWQSGTDTMVCTNISLATSALTGSINLASQVTGTLPVTNGGTGVTSLPGTFVLNGGQAGAVVAGTTDANSLTLRTNGSDRMTVLPSGNVGIGTSNPGDKLHVEGKIRATHICYTDGTNCRDVSTAWSGGSVTSITAGSGLTGGTITGSGTIGLGTELSGLAGLSTTGFVKRTGAGTYTTAAASLTADVSGVLPVANGGTNSSATLNNNRLMISSGGAIVEASAMTDGQIVVGKTSDAPQLVTMSGDATVSNTGVITLKNTGTAGTYAKVTTDAQGRVTSGTTLSASDIPNLDWAKITSGTPTTLSGYGVTDAVQNAGGLPSMQAGIDASKPAAGVTGRLYVATDSARIYRDNGTSWDLIATATTQGLTAVSNSASLADGKIWVGDGSGKAQEQTLAGDITLTNAGAAKVEKVQGTAVSASAPTASGQVLRYNGTQWAPGFIAMTDLRSSVTGSNTFASSCGTNQTLTYNSVGDVMTCANISLPASQITGAIPVAQGGTGVTSLPGTFVLNGGQTGGITAGPSDANTLTLQTAGTSRVQIDSSGNVGVGTTTANVKLAVNGEVQLGNTNATCSASTEGSMRYNSTNKRMEFCNGTSWLQFSQGVVASVTIGSPSASLTKSGPITYTVTYGSGTDTNSISLAPSHISFSGTGTAGCSAAISGTGSTRTVTVTGCTGTGTVAISVAPDSAQSTTGNAASAAGPSATFQADNTGPNAVASITLGSVPGSMTSTPTITYSAPSDVGGSTVASYNVRVLRTSDNNVMKTWAAHTSGNAVTSGLTLAPNTSYYVEIQAVDALGNIGSSYASSNWTTPNELNLTIASDTNNYNIATAAAAAGWAPGRPVILTINSGVTVGSTTTATAALRTGTSAEWGGSAPTITVINNGRIQGKGGAGGQGGAGSTGYAGAAGGPAFQASVAVTMTNNNQLWGGGGGGGGSGAYTNGDGSTTGSGGGGGAGTNSGSGGPISTGVNFNYTGSAGGAGSATGGGSGGVDSGAWGHVGGAGGGPGLAGASGGYGCTSYGGSAGPGGAGGAAGSSVLSNGNITWSAVGDRRGPLN